MKTWSFQNCARCESFSQTTTHFPVAVFAWTLLNTTEICEQKQPSFLEGIQKTVERFHKNLRKLKNTINDFVYEDEDEEHEKPTIIENRGDDKEFLEAFLENTMEPLLS